ncbi:MAG: hypothetical protein QOE36_987 [Gaiellaceae bacterium]|jgi:hypothetical protein|nr:hypothetical protein [Gaiellaceae bacterium]
MAPRSKNCHVRGTLRAVAAARPGTIARMTEADQPIAEQLEEIGTQLDWVRGYL